MIQIDPVTAFGPSRGGDGDDVVANALAFVRTHLDMEVAFLSEFVGNNFVFRVLDAPGFEDRLVVGGEMSLDDTYCRHIIERRLPELIPDTKDEPLTQNITITNSFSVRSHVSIPIYRNNGELFGMFCCLSSEARPSLNYRDLGVMRAFAAMSSDEVNAHQDREDVRRAKRLSIESVLDSGDFDIALQPILRLKDQGTAGYEALCRFTPEPYRPPNLWFEDAADVGLQMALELHVIEVALCLLQDMPDPCYIAVNASPATLASGRISPLVEAAGGKRVVVEITEHAEIENIDALLMEIDRLRDLGARIAVDDAGAGYSGLQQIVLLRPDVIKLDMSLTQDVDKDLARRSLASAMVQFANDTNARVIAEGIETEAEMCTLRQIGVEMGQGYHLGRPAIAQTVLKIKKRA